MNKQVQFEGELAVLSTVKSGVVHPFVMNNTIARNKLLAGAKRDPLVTTKTTTQTSYAELSTGAFKEVVFPLLDHWNQLLKEEQQPRLVPPEQHTVTLLSVREDTEQTSKNLNTLAKFQFDGQNISLFFYHTNQTLMAQGPGHVAFYNSFLLPLVKGLINNALEEIKQCNCQVTRALSPGSLPSGQGESAWRSATPDRQNTLRLVRNPTVNCLVCGQQYETKNKLKNHMDVNHPPQKVQQEQLTGRELVMHGATLLEGPVSLQEEVAHQVLQEVLEEVALQEGALQEEDVFLSSPARSSTPLPPPRPATEDLPCRHCSYTFPNATDLRGHIFYTHKDAGVITCPVLTPSVQVNNIVTTRSQIYPDSVWEQATNQSIVLEANVNPFLDIEIEVLATEEIHQSEVQFQCAVCAKIFKSQHAVNEHFESHGNSENVIKLMQQMHSLESKWNSMFDKQQQLVTSLQQQVHVLQSSLSRRAVVTPTPAVFSPAPVPANVPAPPPAPSVPTPAPRSRQQPRQHQPRQQQPRPQQQQPPRDSLFKPAPGQDQESSGV